MKTKLSLTILMSTIFISTSAQTVNVESSVCGSRQFVFSFVDATGRNFLGGLTDAIYWNSSSNQWEWVDFGSTPPTIFYTNSYASLPNPPCFNIGTWVQVNNGCGNLVNITGDCQSSLTSVQNYLLNEELFTVSPNPSTMLIQIHLYKPLSTGMKYKIFNSIGKIVQEESISIPKFEIDLTELESGLYYISISNNDGVYSKQIVLTR
ncbi:MAG: T9SS C-terminal target domain-containing protein [Bacteroidetes bacterium]|nr:MAG: T9SS C-terminal target domain-containing protein [Bacteroidota bacterium]REK07542.1 MAG: T9SS C-terminal target domain-containing protein [Bacteroidota bacterium]REK37025.1 MAG: T9SS C-terminal target domain-containing protein [Bacteroidota bacterium]REK47847.1 MAG: T9SS C-terminal target domain-containing protein [Bacteroidota bacterium]